MTLLTLQLEKTNFLPLENLKGKFSYEQLPQNETLLLSLYWFTEGRGDQDIHAPLTVEYLPKETMGERDFSIQLPPAPHSFSGKLITLQWILELKSMTTDFSIQKNITISHTTQEIAL